MTKKEIFKKLDQIENYSGEAISALYDYIEDHFDVEYEIDIDDISAWEVSNEDYIDFIYYEDGEKYLKKYWTAGFFSQAIIDLINDIYDCYEVRITSICQLAQFKLEEEISMLINEIFD